MLSDGQEILEGRFIIQKKLGSGAFGEIYKGKTQHPNIYAHSVLSGLRLEDSREGWKCCEFLLKFLIFLTIGFRFLWTVEKKKTKQFYAAKIVSKKPSAIR